MKTSKFTDEQVAMALRQAEAGTPVGEICRKLGVSEQSFYRWKKRFGALGVSELRELRQLRAELGATGADHGHLTSALGRDGVGVNRTSPLL